MRQQYRLICLLILFISGCQAQESTPTLSLRDWNGDPNLCTVNPSVTPSSLPQPPLPTFPNKAEFAIERVEIKHVFDGTLPSVMTLYEYLYDYDANKVIMVKNANGFIEADYFYYDILKKSTYYRGDVCVVTDIPVDIDIDGASAIKLPNGASHVRPLNEYLLFSSNASGREVVPVYLGKDIIRGIPVDKWQSCYINKIEYRTIRRIWYFAQQGYSMATGPVGQYAVPVQAIVSASYSLSNGTSMMEIDEIFNVHAFRPGIIETADALAPPKGVFCASGEGQNLISLKDAGVSWPNRFSVRVEASSSRSAQWQRFHLYYDNGREGTARRLRYDYMPTGAEDFVTVIHDYTDQTTYTIDRRLGSCKIDQGVSIPDVSPIRDPIRFFIKNEEKFIFNPPEKAWEMNGFRPCRGNSIQCAILTTSLDNFPVMVDSDTDKPTGETWVATNVEYGWSMRSPTARPPPNQPKQFDYPVSLYLKMYRFENPNEPSPLNIRTEDIEYEFYEMSHDRRQNDFDTSICYRSLGQPYLHLGFVLKPNNDTLVDGKYLNRLALEFNVRSALVDAMQISRSRLSDVELDHIQSDNSVYVLFTLLGPTPFSSGNVPSIETAQNSLEAKINAGGLTFEMSLIDDENIKVQFKAEPNTLKTFQQFMSIHAGSILNCNTTINPITPTPTTTCPVQVTNGPRIKKEKYTGGAQAGGIIGGLIVGIVIGLIGLVVIQFLNKRSTSGKSNPFGGGLTNVSFSNKRSETSLAMRDLQNSSDKSHN